MNRILPNRACTLEQLKQHNGKNALQQQTIKKNVKRGIQTVYLIFSWSRDKLLPIS